MMIKKLSEIASIEISGVDKKSNPSEPPVKLLNFTDVYYNWQVDSRDSASLMKATAKQDEITKFSVKNGDIAITKDSETRYDIGIPCLVDDDLSNVVLGYHCALIRPKKEMVDSGYLNAYLNSSMARKYFSNQASGSGQRYTLTIDGIGAVKVLLPTLDEQHNISSLIGAINKKIKLNNRINDNLQQLLGLLYERWFYRFEFEKCEKAKVIWNSQLKRNIPIGWKVQNMAENELFSIISSGVTPFGRKTYYATADVNGYSIGEGSEIDYETRESRANMQPYLNSIWFAKMKNSVKHLYLNRGMIDFIDSSILSTGFYGLKCNDTSFEYIASVVSAPIFEATKDRLSHGATQQGISDDDMRNMLLLVPDKETLARYHNATKHMYASISKNLIENKKLSKLRDFLLPLLMNGQATITD